LSFNDVYAVIIEDNKVDSEVLQRLLAQNGVQFGVLTHGRGILAELANHPHPTVVFLDLVMPGASGYEVLNVLKAEPAYRDTMVVAYSSRASDMKLAREAGFHSFLGKPLKSGVFRDQLQRILNGESVWELR
jgi:two-component system cell cycle response regulator DivK